MSSVSINVQKEYFVFKKDYYELKALLEMLRTVGTTSEQLISYMKEKKLDVDSYIELDTDIFVPIIYHVSLTPQHVDFFLWLLANKANPKKQPDVKDTTMGYNILLVCHEKFLKTLVEKCGVTLPKLDDVLFPQIQKKLTYGNLRRIRLLIKLGVLGRERLESATKSDTQLGFKAVDILIDRVKLVCSTHNTKEEVDKLLKKYTELFEFIKPDGLQRNSEGMCLIQYCASFYLHPLITVLISTQESIPAPTYHSDLDPKLVAVMRQLYNDRRYVKTCDALGAVPDTRAF